MTATKIVRFVINFCTGVMEFIIKNVFDYAKLSFIMSYVLGARGFRQTWRRTADNFRGFLRVPRYHIIKKHCCE